MYSQFTSSLSLSCFESVPCPYAVSSDCFLLCFISCTSSCHWFPLSLPLNTVINSDFMYSIFPSLSPSIVSFPFSSVCPLRCDRELGSLCHLRGRQRTDESGSIGNKTDNKSQICSLIPSAVGTGGHEEKERKAEEIVYDSLSVSSCLIQIFLFIVLLSLLLYLQLFTVSLSTEFYLYSTL